MTDQVPSSPAASVSPTAATTNPTAAVVAPAPPPSTTTIQLSNDPSPGTVIYTMSE